MVKSYEKKRRKAVMGIGALIIFIAGILTAAISAGVLLRTQSQLQNKALEVGGKARKGVSVNFQTQSIKLIKDSYDRDYDTLTMIIKLGPGSDDAILNKTFIDITSNEGASILRYGGNSDSLFFVNKNQRHIHEVLNISSWKRARTDFDGDFKEDSLRLFNQSMIQLNLTQVGLVNITIPSIATPPTVFAVHTNITKGENVYGILTLTGTNTDNESITIDNNVTLILEPPEILQGTGIYTVEFMRKDKKNLKDDRMIEGDIVKMYVELATPLVEDDEVMVSIKKGYGQIHRTIFVAPSAFTGDYIDVYP